MALKVLHLSESVGWSGGAAQLLALAKGMKTGGWEVFIAAPKEGELAKRADKAGITVFDFKPRQDYDIFCAYRTAKFIDANKIDVIHAHHPKAHAVALIAKFLCAHKPVLVVSRRVTHPMRYNLFSKIKYHNSYINGYAAVAKAVKKILTDYKIPQEKVRVIYSGVDTGIFHPRPKDQSITKELNLPPSVPVIGLIGNFSADKGQHILLAAAAKVLAKGKNAVFVFAGRDTAGQEIKTIAGDYNIAQENLRFMGFRSDVAEIMSVLDISVNCAVAGEALSGSIRESLAMGTAVIASDIGGNREVVENNVTGKLYPQGDENALAELLLKALDNPAELKQMAQNGLEFVKNNLTTEKMIENSEKFYLDLLEKQKTKK